MSCGCGVGAPVTPQTPYTQRTRRAQARSDQHIRRKMHPDIDARQADQGDEGPAQRSAAGDVRGGHGAQDLAEVLRWKAVAGTDRVPHLRLSDAIQ